MNSVIIIIIVIVVTIIVIAAAITRLMCVHVCIVICLNAGDEFSSEFS